MSSAPSTRKAADPFVSTTLKLWKLANFENAQTLTSLDVALDSLLALDYPLRDLGDQLFSDLLLAGCKAVNTKDRMSCPKFCKLVFIICNKQASPLYLPFLLNLLQGPSLSLTNHFIPQIKIVHLRQQNLETLLHYFLKGLKETDQAETRVDMLRALSTLVFENTANTYKVRSPLFFSSTYLRNLNHLTVVSHLIHSIPASSFLPYYRSPSAKLAP